MLVLLPAMNCNQTAQLNVKLNMYWCLRVNAHGRMNQTRLVEHYYGGNRLTRFDRVAPLIDVTLMCTAWHVPKSR